MPHRSDIKTRRADRKLEGAELLRKANSVAHVRDNRAAADLALDDDEDLAALDRAFPKPSRSRPLEML